MFHRFGLRGGANGGEHRGNGVQDSANFIVIVRCLACPPAGAEFVYRFRPVAARSEFPLAGAKAADEVLPAVAPYQQQVVQVGGVGQTDGAAGALGADFGLVIVAQDGAHMGQQPIPQAAKGDAEKAIGKDTGFAGGRGGHGRDWRLVG